MTYLADDLEIMRLSRQLRNLSDDALGAMHRNAVPPGLYAAEYEMFRRLACRVSTSPVPRFLKLLAEDAKEMECA